MLKETFRRGGEDKKKRKPIRIFIAKLASRLMCTDTQTRVEHTIK